MELFCAILIVLVLLALAVFFGLRQVRLLRSLAGSTELASEDRRYYRRQAWRRLVCCGLMVIFAAMLGGWYGFGLNQRAEELRAEGRIAADAGAGFTVEQQRVVNLLSIYWMIATLVLLAMICLAFVDLWAIRRFGLRHLRQIQSDRRAMIEQEMANLRTQRNGHE